MAGNLHRRTKPQEKEEETVADRSEKIGFSFRKLIPTISRRRSSQNRIEPTFGENANDGKHVTIVIGHKK